MIKRPNDKQWRLARKTMIFMHTYHYNKIWANISYLPVQNYWQYILQSTFLRKNRTHFDTSTMDTRNDQCLYITLSNHNNKVLINSDMHFCTSECSFICRSIILTIYRTTSTLIWQCVWIAENWSEFALILGFDPSNWKFFQSQNLRKSML